MATTTVITNSKYQRSSNFLHNYGTWTTRSAGARGLSSWRTNNNMTTIHPTDDQFQLHGTLNGAIWREGN